MHRYLTLALFVALVLGGGTLIGLMTLPGEWYAGLAKPSFNPPNWIFAPVWTLLYIMVAVAGWRTWQHSPRSAAMAVWFIQLALNFVWSPTFFGAHRIGAAQVIVVALLTTIVAFIVMRWPGDRAAALLFMPYAAWVAFATLLNGALWYLN
ncbi:MAG TPA: TspO/MBR family protein [Pseudolabrys sp.]